MRIFLIAPRPSRSGAQEKDIISGIEMLRKAGMSVEVRFITPKFKSLKANFHNLRPRHRAIALLLTLFWPEGQVRAWLRSIETSSLIFEIAESDFDVIWTETSDLAFFGLFSSKPHISRSHNFDPYHFFQESKSWFIGVSRCLLKLLNLITFERRADTIFAISPSDQKLYQKVIRRNKIALMPLRDLIVNHPAVKSPIEVPQLNRIAILASTYSVWHNREMIINLRSMNFLTLSNTEIHLFGSKIPQEFILSAPANITVRGWINDLSEIYREFDVFLVPTKRGMGMKSKVFEPLTRNKIVISYRTNLSGYDSYFPLKIVEIQRASDIAHAITSLSELDLVSMRLGNNRAIARLFDYELWQLILTDTIQRTLSLRRHC